MNAEAKPQDHNTNEIQEPDVVAQETEEEDVSIATENQAAAGSDFTHAQAEQEAAALKDQLLRTMAEMENVRKRAQRDIEDASKYAISSFARELVSVLENLQRAVENIPSEARQENSMLNTLGEGVEMTLRELLGAFEKHGIHRIDPLGEKFDHNLHQAVVQIEDPSHPPGTVVQVMQAGYTINGRLLRPAMVGVSKPPAGGAENTPVNTQA